MRRGFTIRPTRGRGFPLVLCVLFLNLVFWAWFWIEVTSMVVPYEWPPLTMDFDPPAYVWFGYAVPPSMHFELPFRLMDRVQMPANLLSRYAIWGFLDWWVSGQYVVRGKTIAGTSEVGYIVFATMILSFIQWYVIGVGLNWLSRRVWSRPTSPGNTPPLG